MFNGFWSEYIILIGVRVKSNSVLRIFFKRYWSGIVESLASDWINIFDSFKVVNRDTIITFVSKIKG